MPAARSIQQESTWNWANNPAVFELFEKTLLVVGVGAISSRTAQVGQALGMRVIGVRRNPQRSDPSMEQILVQIS
ncbi:MAG: NAD(P)-dependent oxidoreductase [Candidatus Poribacteria bacterium]|nr:NAD(P)-dependent oxidoreductase [Candidatus Poribacteria bacterium]